MPGDTFGAIGAMVNFSIAYLVAKMNPQPPMEVREMIERIRLP
jgi:cation/acetate symporter